MIEILSARQSAPFWWAPRISTTNQPIAFNRIPNAPSSRRLLSVTRAAAGGGGSEDISARAQELLRRAEALRREQAEVEAELAALGELSGTAGISQTTEPGGAAEKAFKGVVPPGVLRDELERLLGLHDDETDGTIEQGIPHEEAEEFARMLEEGRGTLAPPPDFYSQPPEPAEEFLARLEASVKEFESLVAGKKELARRRRQAAADGSGRNGGGTFFDGSMEDLMDAEMFPEESSRNVPAPDIPPEAEAQFNRAERIVLVIRRSLLMDRAPVAAPFEALAAKGLLADYLMFEDPWLAVEGVEEAREYLQLLDNAGATIDMETVFSSYYEYKPEVRCRVMVHTLLRLPLPWWYLSFLELHDQPPPPPPPPFAPRRQPGEPIRIDAEVEGSFSAAMFPRQEAPDLTEVERNGTAHAAWLFRPTPLACSPQVLASLIQDGQFAFHRIHSNRSRFSAAASRRRPDYSKLPPASAILEGEVGWRAAPLEPPPRDPPLPRPGGTADFERYPLTPTEAEQLLRGFAGDQDFEALKGQISDKAPGDRPPGDISDLSIGATWAYDVDPGSGKVSSIELHWGWVGGPFPHLEYAYDVFIAQCGLFEAFFGEAQIQVDFP